MKIQFTLETKRNYVLKDHKDYKSGAIQSVCVSTCLNYLGIPPTQYKYTSSNANMYAYENVLRRHNYNVRSRASEFKLKKYKSTLTEIKANIRKSNYRAKDKFLIHVINKKNSHLILIRGNGETIIDTAPAMRWKVLSIKHVF